MMCDEEKNTEEKKPDEIEQTNQSSESTDKDEEDEEQTNQSSESTKKREPIPIYYNDKIVRYLLPGEDAPDNTEPVTDENGYIKQFIIPDDSIKDISKQMKIKPMKRKLYIDFNSF